MSATFRLDGSSAGAVKAVQDFQKALDAAEKGADGAGKATKRMQEAAQRIKESVDPQEKYNNRIKKLAELVTKAGLDTDTARLKAHQYNVELERVSQSGDKAFGAGMIGNLAKMAAGSISVAGAVGAVKAAFQEAEAAAQSSADAIFAAVGDIRELQQLGPAGFGKGALIARDLVQSGVVAPGNRSQAIGIASNLINAGYSDSEIAYVTNDLSKIVKAENLTGIGGDLRKLKRTFGDTADLPAVADQLLAGANATQADLATTTNQILKFAQFAVKSGADLDDTISAFVVAEGQAPNPDAAAENLKSFFSQTYKRDLRGGSLPEILANVQGKMKGGKSAFDVLGDANAVLGFEMLAGQQAQYGEINSAVRQAIQDRIVVSSGDLMNQDPIARSAALRGRAGGAEAIAGELRSAEGENLFDAMRAELNAVGAQRGEFALTRYGRNKMLDYADTADEQQLAFLSELLRGQSQGPRISPELQSAMADYLVRNPTSDGAPEEMRTLIELQREANKRLEQIANGQRSRVVTRPE